MHRQANAELGRHRHDGVEKTGYRIGGEGAGLGGGGVEHSLGAADIGHTRALGGEIIGGRASQRTGGTGDDDHLAGELK